MADLHSTPKQKIMAIFAHPDDEVFCAGGTLARYATQGAETVVISATSGQAGQILDMHLARRETLGSVRATELQASCQHLGITHVECWDYPDGALADVPREQVVGDVVRAIRQYQPHVIITFGADGAYGHPDHVAIHEITTEAFYLAGDTHQYLKSLEKYAAHQPDKLYYAYFPQRQDLLLHLLVDWLTAQEKRFFGTPEFVAGLSIFAKESTMLNYIGDFVEIRWYTPNFCILEQGEESRDLFVILSGHVDVFQETESGDWTQVEDGLSVGTFFGETGIANNARRNAHVVARDSVTCLVFSPQERTNFEARGNTEKSGCESEADEIQVHIDTGDATHVIDVSNHIRQKIKAMAAHRTQFATTEDMFPLDIVKPLFGQEYFVQAFPPRKLEQKL